MKEKDFLDNNHIIDEENSNVDILETGPEMYREENNHKEIVGNIERKIGTIKQKIEVIEECMSTLKEAYVDAKEDEKSAIRSMVTSADWALHRAERELSDTLEALGLMDTD